MTVENQKIRIVTELERQPDNTYKIILHTWAATAYDSASKNPRDKIPTTIGPPKDPAFVGTKDLTTLNTECIAAADVELKKPSV